MHIVVLMVSGESGSASADCTCATGHDVFGFATDWQGKKCTKVTLKLTRMMMVYCRKNSIWFTLRQNTLELRRGLCDRGINDPGLIMSRSVVISPKEVGFGRFDFIEMCGCSDVDV